MTDPHVVDAVDPDEAFGVLSDPARVDVLHALWEAEDHEATFSDLRAAVGMTDSGRFNYHLGRFEGQFVTRRGDRYALTTAGRRLVGALMSGAYTGTVDVDAVPVSVPCPSCGGDMTFGYDRGAARVDCDDCRHVSYFPVPAGVFAGYDVADLPGVAADYSRRFVRSARDGFCPFCEGHTRASVVPVAETVDASVDAERPDWIEEVPTCRFDCDRCGEALTADLGTTLHEHPAVVSFHYDRDVDVRAEPVWRFSALDPDAARLEQRDPLVASVTYTAGDDALRVTVDEDLSVLETTVAAVG